ncbi:25.3 kDa vesicle transport protein SEC22-1 [Aristolochia californica]|uniref:25.3 kDa vesicle transport protein SEC22-1 n=1 Tax=Aristolochia californica TaxID=171875 RepID=UPI0035D66085
MIKLTIVGRVSDGLPLARGPCHLSEENENTLYYRQQGEMILREISKATLTASKMSIRTDHFLFHYMVENGICYIALCDSSYPRKLALHYLEDLEKELKKVDIKVLETISRPYSFMRFDYVIGHIRKQYLDTRTPANFSKLNNSQLQEIVMTEDISNVINNGQKAEIAPHGSTPTTKTSIWSSGYLEVIALKWTPVAMIVIVAAILLWASLVLTDHYIMISY